MNFIQLIYRSEHFAIFPEDLIANIIKFSTQRGDWVLDPFVGRGTTGMVSVLLGRNFLGIDLYQENVVKTKKNILDTITGKNALKSDGRLVETLA